MKKSKKITLTIIIVAIILILLALAITLPLVLIKKKPKPEIKEVSLDFTATKTDGAGTFTAQKWFTKVGEDVAEHTAEEGMTLTAESGKTVYYGLNYDVTYKNDGGAYLENLTYNTDLIHVSYALCTLDAADATHFGEAVTSADWQAWTNTQTPTTDNCVLLKVEVQELTSDQTAAVGLSFAVVDGPSVPLKFTNNYSTTNYYTQIDGESQMYGETVGEQPINLYIKEGETIYLGFYFDGIDYSTRYYIDSLTFSDDVEISFANIEHSTYDAPTIEEFNNGILEASVWTSLESGHTYDSYDHILSIYSSQIFFVLKIVAKDSISAEELSVNLTLGSQQIAE